MATEAELVRLLLVPNESLTLEYKSWLDLTGNHGRATLAKAAIALANEGGGIVILGMRPAENAPLASEAMPAGTRRYDQDAINSAINRYADPEVHCELSFAIHPGTGVEHAFVVVPGGMTVPVMSTRDQQGEIMARRCYVRKPGPRSEEPITAEEWHKVLERCLHARRESMLDAIRLIVQGHPPAPPVAERAALTAFCEGAHRRWLQLVEPLPADDPGRMPLGYYRFCFEIIGVPPAANFVDLRNWMDDACRIKHTGWGPFVILNREDLAPRVVDDAIEVWLGAPEPERVLTRTPEHCDFWRASRSGLLYLQRGYDEDGSDRAPPGTLLDITLPIWRTGEALLYVSRLARQFGDNPAIFTRVSYTGLRNRELGDINRRITLRAGRRSADNEVSMETQATAVQIEDNVVEIVHTLLAPLYERFEFFELPRDLVAREVERMRRNRF